MEKNCFIQSLIGSVSDKKMKGYLQNADFSNFIVGGIGYEVGKYWADSFEEKRSAEASCAIDPITISGVRNGTIVRSKNSNYIISKVSSKVEGTYESQSSMYQDISGDNVALYITIKRADLQPITEQLVISDIVEIISQYPTTYPNINNPLIEIEDWQYVETPSSTTFDRTPTGGYILLNYNHSSYPYQLVRKNSAMSITSVKDSQNKTVKAGDKYYVYNGTMWEELE